MFGVALTGGGSTENVDEFYEGAALPDSGTFNTNGIFAGFNGELWETFDDSANNNVFSGVVPTPANSTFGFGFNLGASNFGSSFDFTNNNGPISFTWVPSTRMVKPLCSV